MTSGFSLLASRRLGHSIFEYVACPQRPLLLAFLDEGDAKFFPLAAYKVRAR
jgi:hypothetical protein